MVIQIQYDLSSQGILVILVNIYILCSIVVRLALVEVGALMGFWLLESQLLIIIIY